MDAFPIFDQQKQHGNDPNVSKRRLGFQQSDKLDVSEQCAIYRVGEGVG